MSIFSSALNLVKDVASVIPGGQIVASAIDLFSSIANKVAPLVNDLIQASPLPQEAKDIAGKAYDFGWG